MKESITKKVNLIRTGALASALSALSAAPVYAQIGDGIKATEGAADTGANDLNAVIRNVINVLLFVVGVAAVIMLIVGGIRYVVSAGDQQAVAGAKNTILYAIVGIVVAVLAYAAVNFVFTTLTG